MLVARPAVHDGVDVAASAIVDHHRGELHAIEDGQLVGQVVVWRARARRQGRAGGGRDQGRGGRRLRAATVQLQGWARR